MSFYLNPKHACDTDVKLATRQYGSKNGYDSDGGVNWKRAITREVLTNFKMYRNFKDRMTSAQNSVAHSIKSGESEHEFAYEVKRKQKGNATIKEEGSYMLDTSNFIDNLPSIQLDNADKENR